MPRPNPRPGEIWVIDLGIAGKVWPCLVLTEPPADEDLHMVTVVLHTTALRGSQWELPIPKPFLKAGAFQLQEVHSSPIPRLERKLGELSDAEFNQVLDRLEERFGL